MTLCMCLTPDTYQSTTPQPTQNNIYIRSSPALVLPLNFVLAGDLIKNQSHAFDSLETLGSYDATTYYNDRGDLLNEHYYY